MLFLGLMVFYYNEAMPFQRGNGFSEMQIALEKGKIRSYPCLIIE